MRFRNKNDIKIPGQHVLKLLAGYANLLVLDQKNFFSIPKWSFHPEQLAKAVPDFLLLI